MTVLNEYIVLGIGATVGFSIPSIILGIICMINLTNFLFGAIWFTLGCSGIGAFIMFFYGKMLNYHRIIIKNFSCNIKYNC